MEREIDLVVSWVNGDDLDWQMQREPYECKKEDKLSFLYRDWGLMRYWFRGVEKNLPWIHRIHFITWGHIPPWLNIDHPKLHIVNHKEYIPGEFRPTFSSHPIEWNIHRIGGLSEMFIYANDDMFFIGPLDSNYYFKGKLPCDCLRLMPITENCTHGFGHILLNNITCINRSFSLKECMENNPEKWFAPAYSPDVLGWNRIGYQLEFFPGFRNEHLPIPFLKSTFEEVWEKNTSILRQTCMHRFRSIEDVNIWLVRYWQLAKGTFYPRMPVGTSVSVSDSKKILKNTLLNTQYPVICLIESENGVDFEERSAYLHNLFEMILPEMSAYELY